MFKLQNMIAGMRNNHRWYEFKAMDEGTTEIYIYDEIGFFGVSAKVFIDELNAVKTDKIVLRINSPGGSTFEGMPIYNALKRHPAHITTVIDGIALSMASVIALAGDDIHIVNNGLYMIHNAWSIAVGDAEDMRKTAEIIDKINETIVGIYASHTGMTEDKIRQLMAEETWYNADEALESGFVNKVVDASEDIITNAKIEISAFKNVPDALKTMLSKEDNIVEFPKEDDEEKPANDDALENDVDFEGDMDLDDEDDDPEAFDGTMAQMRAKARLRLAEAQDQATAR